jgi:hypothetical protein
VSLASKQKAEEAASGVKDAASKGVEAAKGVAKDVKAKVLDS